MSLPIFPTGGDPGPSFVELLRRSGAFAGVPGAETAGPTGASGGPSAGTRRPSSTLGEPATRSGVPHGTTIVALRFADGVVVAGDRRATEGHSIAHRGIEKVF